MMSKREVVAEADRSAKENQSPVASNATSAREGKEQRFRVVNSVLWAAVTGSS
jgi:K+-transporting ATPase A subunit